MNAHQPIAAKPRFAWGRWLIVALLAAAVAGYLIAGPSKAAAWQWVLDNYGRLQVRVERHPYLTLAIFAAIYVAVTALSLPIAIYPSILAGALFGRWVGTGMISFASTTGATLAFLSSRYLLRGWVQVRYGPRLEAIDRGMARDGAFYLFTLRLLPIVPFFLINLGMGVTRLPVRTFWWVSQLGMLPMTFVYVNAGTELGSIKEWRDIASPTLLISLTLVGLLPLVFRLLLKRGQAID